MDVHRNRRASEFQYMPAKSPTRTTFGRGSGYGRRPASSLGDTSGTDAAVIDDVVAPTTGTYLVLVASFDSGVDGTGTYRLTMTHTPGPITVSPGDEGGPLTNGATHTGEITQGDVDVWTFTAIAGQRISLHIGETTDTDDFRPWIRLWSPTGSTWGIPRGPTQL